MPDTKDKAGTATPAMTLAFFALCALMAFGAMAHFGAHWAAWVVGIIVVVCLATATFGVADGPSRNFLSGTLRHQNYTQIYRTLVKRTHRRIWDALCDPVDPDASLLATFRAALTWRLYDRALLLAVAYPVVLPVLWWLVSGQAAQLGSSVFLESTDRWCDVWLERAVALGAIAILIAAFFGQRLAYRSARPIRRIAAIWLQPLAITGAVVTAVALAEPDAFVELGALAAAIALAVAFALSAAFALEGLGALAVANGITLAFLAAVVIPVEGLGTISVADVGSLEIVLTAALTAALIFVVIGLDTFTKKRLSQQVVTLAAILLWVIAATLFPWKAADGFTQSIFIFLAVFPLANALFDVVSYAVTLTLIHRGLRAPRPFWNGLADLALALLLFLGLGVTLVAVISILNDIAGTDILDVLALLQDVEANPHAYWWLYAMVFSTILPTALHGLLAALGVQGIWPRALRRPVADWVDSADRTQLHNLRAAFALGLIWAVPVCVLILVGWCVWHVGGDAARTFAGWYLSVLDQTTAFFFVGEAP